MPPKDQRPTGAGLSRREFLDGAVRVAAAGAIGGVLPGCGSSTSVLGQSSSGRSGRQTVAVFGGGVAGLTAAHELAARGFDVAVYERRAWGGKARSRDVRDGAK